MTLALQDVYLGRKGARVASLDDLETTHGVGARSARTYSRFFGQTGVRLCAGGHRDLLRDALEGLLVRRPDLRGVEGYGLYAKTQTHNTPFEADWLRGLFEEVGLGHWEAATFSMTNCASGLAAVQLGAVLGRPFVVLAGEKAFHAAGSRLSVGLLGEAGVSAAFGPGPGRRLRGSRVVHLPRYHVNPDAMAPEDRKALQTDFEAGLIAFLQGLVSEDPAFFARRPVVVPYNLNAPLIARALRAAGLDGNLAEGVEPSLGHMFCSDPYLAIARVAPPSDAPLLLFCAGHGVTFAAIKLDPDPPRPTPKGPR